MIPALLALLTVHLPGAPPRAFDQAAVAALPQATATAEFHGYRLTCTGPRLDVVLAAAGAPAGEALREPALARAVLAEGADGYRVAFAPGELDPMLGNRTVVVAARCNGKPLPSAEGPLRLLADGDRRGARAVHRLVTLRVVELGK